MVTQTSKSKRHLIGALEVNISEYNCDVVILQRYPFAFGMDTRPKFTANAANSNTQKRSQSATFLGRNMK